jgi:hypothetical protein
MGDGGGFGWNTGRADLDRFLEQGDRRFYDTSGVPGAVEVQELFEESYEIRRDLGRHDEYVAQRMGQLDAIDQLREQQQRAQSGPAEWKESKTELQRQAATDPSESEGNADCTTSCTVPTKVDWQHQADVARRDFQEAATGVFSFAVVAAFGVYLMAEGNPWIGGVFAIAGGAGMGYFGAKAIRANERLEEAQRHGAR